MTTVENNALGCNIDVEACLFYEGYRAGYIVGDPLGSHLGSHLGPVQASG